MPKVVFLTNDGQRLEHEIKAGWSVMQGAMRNSVPGIEADCGGSMSCATCHVYVDEAWFEKAGQPDEIEQEMLDMIPSRRPNSRLSCQLKVTAVLDGVVVQVPEDQTNVSL